MSHNQLINYIVCQVFSRTIGTTLHKTQFPSGAVSLIFFNKKTKKSLGFMIKNGKIINYAQH